MKKGYTHISLLLDKSGSMQSIRDDTIGGFNRFLADQQHQPGEATFSFVQFDDNYEPGAHMLPLREAKNLNHKTYTPTGSTALFDAIGRMIEETGAALAALHEYARPEKVIFAILTDGQENASQRYGLKQVNEKITHQRTAYKWEFVFLGANQDAMATAATMGVARCNTVTFASNDIGTQSVMNSFSGKLSAYRSGKDANMKFAASDYAAQTVAGVAAGLNNPDADPEQDKTVSAG